ncbi:MAG: hypothetical protein ACOYOB_01175 [Myxococcota bacterium]
MGFRGRLCVGAAALVSVAGFSVTAAAAPKSGAAALSAAYLGASARDVAVLATAVPQSREGMAGSAALVRVDDGSDGGNPACHVVAFAGRPSAPIKVEAATRLSTCPRFEKDKSKGVRFERIALGARRGAWLVRLETARVDSIAKGIETQTLWALLASNAQDPTPQQVWERASTTFKSREDPRLNQAEQCEAPVVRGGSAPEVLELPCETETMLGTLPKRQRQVFRYLWEGDRFRAE